METSAQQAARLLIAVEELADRESTFLRGGYYDLATESRERTEPLVQQLIRLAGQPGLDAYQPSVTALQARNAENDAFLSGKMTELAIELRRIEEARQRATRMAPAYSHATDHPSVRWQAAV